MKIHKRATIAVLTVASSLALTAPLASAEITPKRYRTSAGSGSFTGSSVVGPSTCQLAKLVATARGTRSGAKVKVRGFEASCTGAITSAHYDRTIGFRIRRGKVTGTISIVITNALGGRCRYRGRVTGSLRNGTGTLSAAGPVRLIDTLAKPCAPDSQATLKVKLPKAKISW